jgi:flavin reductase (DIM6/NTAB) family NADH-FMN oxidoreductase RutF
MSPSAIQVEAEDKESLIKRNPHADFAAVEALRPLYNPSNVWTPSKTPNPTYRPGSGASSPSWKAHATISIDPHSPSRTVTQDYKLMISSTVPRPIALVSTISKDGRIENLAPFSYFNYFNNVCNDPPLYSISFHGELPTDSLRNLLETEECCISIVSDWFLDAMNMSSVNTPPNISEWPLSGLQVSKSDVVRLGFGVESAFSMECKLHSIVPISPRTRWMGRERRGGRQCMCWLRR